MAGISEILIGEPNWQPLRELVGATCEQGGEHEGCPMNGWMWMRSTLDGYEHYKHAYTRFHVRLPRDLNTLDVIEREKLLRLVENEGLPT